MDITGLTPAITALMYMRDLLTDPVKFAEFARTIIEPCDPNAPIESCIDDICHQNGKQIPRKLGDDTVRFLSNQVKGLMQDKKFLNLFKSPGIIMRAFLEGQKDQLCKPDTTAQTEPEKTPATGDAQEFSITIEDAAGAGALTAGAKLVYDLLVFGSALCPPARPATQGLLMLIFGTSPAGFEDESPRDRMMREGA